MVFCTNCGHKLEDNQKFCTKCGKAVNTAANSTPPESKQVEEKPVEAPKNNVIEDAKPAAQHNEEPISTAAANVNDTQEAIPVQPGKNYAAVKKSALAFKKPWVVALLSIVCILGVLIGIFSKQVKGGYYLVRYNLEKDTVKRFEYSALAVSGLNISSTYNSFKASSEELIKQDPDMVETKLDELKSTLKPEDYKALKISLYNEKIKTSVTSGKYDEALSNLIKLQKSGGNIRDNPKYETIMLNVIAKTTGVKVFDSKASLKKGANIIFDNLDDDAFDEIIEIKDLNPNEDFEKQYDINLYKLQNNEYTKVASEITRMYNYLGDFGIYNYDKNKMGLYVTLTETSYVSSACVYKIKDSKFNLIGTVGSSDNCNIMDIDNDGIFEISTTQLNDPNNQYSHADMPRITSYYKFSDDSDPKVVKVDNTASNSSAAAASPTNTDYIFPESNSRCLSESEVTALSKEQLGYARNEIYARHGYVFNIDKYVKYFNSKSWYKPDPSFVASDSNLNQYEIENYRLIQKYEK